jgi:transketolase
VTVEEHSIFGGLGGAVAEVVAVEHPTRMKILGVPGVFALTGSAEFLLEYFHLTAKDIAEAARELIAAKTSGMRAK